MKIDVAEQSDSEIINRVLRGDVNAFEYLMDRYCDLVIEIVRKRVPHNDVEESIQNVFIRAYQSLAYFKGNEGFRQWLASIAVRTCYDYWRGVYRHKEIPMSSLSEKHREWLEQAISEISEESLHEKGLQAEAKEILDYALGKLCAEDRVVLELIHLEGYTGKEAAKLLGWSVSNVKVRAFRSRKKIKKILSKSLMK
jgi:RNA polymerase sigma-70 factor (ECF subfamily)